MKQNKNTCEYCRKVLDTLEGQLLAEVYEFCTVSDVKVEILDGCVHSGVFAYLVSVLAIGNNKNKLLIKSIGAPFNGRSYLDTHRRQMGSNDEYYLWPIKVNKEEDIVKTVGLINHNDALKELDNKMYHGCRSCFRGLRNGTFDV